MKASKSTPGPRHVEVSRSDIDPILNKAKSFLDAEEYDQLCSLISTLEYLTTELGKKNASVRRLRAMLFGPKSEKSSAMQTRLKKMLADADSSKQASREADAPAADETETHRDKTAPASGMPKKNRSGGRRKASDYTGGTQHHVEHPDLKHKQACPECANGRVYLNKTPKVLVRLTGGAPIQADVWSYDWLRCNLCDTIFNAPLPEEVGEADKHDESVTSTIGVLRYGYGMPMTRLARLQDNVDIPLPASTQWQLVDRGAHDLEPVFQALIRHAARGNVIYNDDTTARILEVMAAQKSKPPDKKGKERTGTFTTGLISTLESSRQVALFLTGRQHAGENLNDVLATCQPEPRELIQMSDGLSRNTPKSLPEGLRVIEANCLTHGRRKYVEIADAFPDYCLHVIEQIALVYKNEAHTRIEKMSAQQRLEYHQKHSASVMADLKTWLRSHIDEKRVEPNSSFGEATSYMLTRWDRLTRFLTVAGAPLDNNVCERALKRAIRHRKNSMFYKTLHGARVGDIYMSLIHTCELNDKNPLHYLTALLRHRTLVAENPDAWLPWNYEKALAAAVGAEDDLETRAA